MANNKVQLADGTTLIDLTSDTVTPQTLVAPATAHTASGEQITGVVNLANAGDTDPRPNNINASPGSSNNYSREDHIHPFSYFTYKESSGSFLDWCETLFTIAGSYFVIFATNNYDGWPVGELGCAIVQKRNFDTYIIAHTSSNLLFVNKHTHGDQLWYGWKRIPRYSDLPSAGDTTPLSNSSNGSPGSSAEYARKDHRHPINAPVSFTCANGGNVQRGECKGIYDPNSGLVRIKGFVSNTSTNLSTSDTLFTVPSDYRPKATVLPYGTYVLSNGSSTIYNLSCGTDGVIKQPLSNSVRSVIFECEYPI